MVEIKIEFSQIPHTKFKIIAFVLEHSNQNIILGTKFLNKAGVIMNFKKGTIEIENQVVIDTSNGEDEALPFPDKLIMNKCYSAQEVETQFEQIIQNAKKNNKVLGEANGVKHVIKLKDNIPVYIKAYKVPLASNEDVKEEIDRLKELGITRDSSSKYFSPAFAIRKKNGSIRLLIDYRKLNEKTVKEVYPFPGLDEVLSGLDKAKCFSTIDLCQGYYQLGMEDNSIKYTAFILPFGHYEFVRMPFGLMNAPENISKGSLKHTARPRIREDLLR